jgi:hypothetical protein
MQFAEQGNAHPVPITETHTRAEGDKLACQSGSPRLGWLRTYCRVVGGIQWLYAAFFGWSAAMIYSTGQFYNPEFHFKDFYAPAHLDFKWLVFTVAYALLSFSGFVGGYGVLRLLPWVRRWEAAYLSVLAAGVAVGTVRGLSNPLLTPADLTSVVLFFTAFALPYVPFLFGVAGDDAKPSSRIHWAEL